MIKKIRPVDSFILFADSVILWCVFNEKQNIKVTINPLGDQFGIQLVFEKYFI